MVSLIVLQYTRVNSIWLHKIITCFMIHTVINMLKNCGEDGTCLERNLKKIIFRAWERLTTWEVFRNLQEPIQCVFSHYQRSQFYLAMKCLTMTSENYKIKTYNHKSVFQNAKNRFQVHIFVQTCTSYYIEVSQSNFRAIHYT